MLATMFIFASRYYCEQMVDTSDAENMGIITIGSIAGASALYFISGGAGAVPAKYSHVNNCRLPFGKYNVLFI